MNRHDLSTGTHEVLRRFFRDRLVADVAPLRHRPKQELGFWSRIIYPAPPRRGTTGSATAPQRTKPDTPSRQLIRRMEHDVSTSRMADEFKEILARQKRAAKARLDAR